jgi:hypothetical protein
MQGQIKQQIRFGDDNQRDYEGWGRRREGCSAGAEAWLAAEDEAAAEAWLAAEDEAAAFAARLDTIAEISFLCGLFRS